MMSVMVTKMADFISTVSQAFTLSFSIYYQGTVDSGQIYKPYCSITHWSIWGSIQLHWPHNWSLPLCCGKHFTGLASILINSLLLIMYLIDQFGPRVNWSIILIFFFFLFFFVRCGVKWGANCSGLNVWFYYSLHYCLPSLEVVGDYSKYDFFLLNDVTMMLMQNRQRLSVFQHKKMQVLYFIVSSK